MRAEDLGFVDPDDFCKHKDLDSCVGCILMEYCKDQVEHLELVLELLGVPFE